MCYSRPVERIGIRELRNHASRVVRRAHEGERIVITVDGIPMAQIVPMDAPFAERSIDDLVAAGLLVPRRPGSRHARPTPVPSPGPRASTDVLTGLRER